MIVTPTVILIVGLLLCLKHFIVDGLMQTPYQYLNKGNLGHPGGYVHAGLHGFVTLLIFAPFGFAWLGLIDAFVHFWVDWAKVNITKKNGWSEMISGGTVQVGSFGEPKRYTAHLAIYSDYYFYALIADQCLHFATYIAIIFLMGVI